MKTISIALSALLTAGLTAQSPSTPTSILGPDAFTMPIHSAAPDAGLAYGIWASGPEYKVSFGDAVTFVPILGADYPENLPLSWKTTSVTIGGEEISLVDAIRSHTDWRYEYQYGAITEAYDVRTEGVEQTFVIDRRLNHAGDLIIRGSLSTELFAQNTGARHGSLEFSDDNGNPILSYGAATVVDDKGDELKITTSLEDGIVTIRVPGAWLEQATYPVVVDPLLATKQLSGSLGAVLSAPQIARDDYSNELAIIYTRLASAADKDIYSSLVADDLSTKHVIFGDITAAWSTPNGDVAFVNGSHKWLFCIERDFRSLSYKSLSYKLHDSGDHSVKNSVSGLVGGAGHQMTRCAVGGATGSSTIGIVVFQRDETTGYGHNTTNSLIQAVRIDTATSIRLDLTGINAPIASYDSERPCVTELKGTNDSWLVTFQQYNNNISGDDWDAQLVRIGDTGPASTQTAIGDTGSANHCLRPRIGGSNGHFWVAFGRRPNAGARYSGMKAPEIYMQSIEWASSAPSASKGMLQQLRAGSSLTVGEVAFDNTSQSCWAIASIEDAGDHVFVDRIGHDGGIAESANAGTTNNAVPPAITFDDDHNDFTIFYPTNMQINARKMVFPTLTPYVYGSACTFGNIRPRRFTHAGQAWAGNKNFEVSLTGAKPNRVVILLMSFDRAAIDLGSLGMHGCSLNVDPSLMLGTLTTSTDASGFATRKLPLPAPLDGKVYFQWAVFEAGANALDLLSTKGLAVEIK